MLYKIRLFKCTLIAFSGLFGLSAYAAESTQKSDTHIHRGYVKPGAAISLRHDYDGQTYAGELETFTVTLEHIYEAGYLTVQWLETPELVKSSDTNPNQTELSAGSLLTLPVQFSSVKKGRHMIGLEVIYESLEGQQSRRVLSVPVTIGTTAASKSLPTPSAKAAPKAAQGLITMVAQETIK